MLSFDALQYANAKLYESAELNEKHMHSATHTEIEGTSSVTASDALLTLVLTRGTTTAATDYFANNPAELWLDDVFMSHAMPTVDFIGPGVLLQNTIATHDSGRSELVLDPTLLTNCPLNKADATTCVTTHDFDATGALARVSGGVAARQLLGIRTWKNRVIQGLVI